MSNNTLVVGNADGSQRQVLQDGATIGGAGGAVSGLTGASDVAVSPNGQFVYVTSSTADTIAIFARSTATGDLTFVQKVSGAANTYSTLTMSADGTQLYAGGPAGLTAYTVNTATGALSGAHSASSLASLGVDEIVQSADGTHLFVATASNSLVVLDSTTLAVTQTVSGPNLGLAGASDLALAGNDLYVTSATGDTLSVFAVSGSTLTYLQTLQNGVNGVRGLSDPSDVAASADGKFVMVSGQATDSVSVFQRATDGTLTFVQIVTNNVGGVSGIAAPTGLFVSGSTLLVASGDGTIATLAMDTTQAEANVTVVDFSAIESVSVITGAGNDTLTIAAAPSAEVAALTIDTGDGNDHVWVSAAAATTTVDLGAGDDQADISYTTSHASVTVSGGDGNDQLNVTQVGANSTTVVSGDAGNDTVEVLGSNVPSTASVTAHGGTGTDALQFDPQDPTPGTPNYTPASPNPNAGTLQVTGRGVLTYDTFDGTSVVAAPIITVPQTPVTIAEGGTLTLSVAITPLGTGNVLQSVMWDLDGSGTYRTSAGSSITLTWAQLAEIGVVNHGTYSVWVRATNGDGTSTNAQVTFVVTNAEPVITLHGAATTPVDTPYAITFSASDPGINTVSSWQVDWGDGTIETYGASATGASHSYEVPAAYAISVSAYDADSVGAAATATTSVTAQVSSSQISAGGPYAITEGSGVTLSATAPGTVSNYVWTVNGTVVSGTGTNGQSLTLSWQQLTQLGVNDNGTFHVSVTAAYAGGISAASAQTATLLVANAAPTATLATTPGTVAEGGAATVSFTNASDASPIDAAVLTYSYDFNDDGTFEITNSTLSTVNIPTSVTGTAGSHIIHGRVTDKDGASTDVYATLTVTDVPPTLNVAGNPTTLQGATYSLSLSGTEPGNDTISQWVVNWGDGNSSTVNGATATLTHVFTAVGSDTIHVTAVDSAGSYAASLPITVQNAPPVLSNLGLSSVGEGQQSHLTGTVSDPGNDPLTVTVTWSDGSHTSETLATGATSFDLTHVFLDNGTVSASVVLSDGPLGNPGTLTANGTANAVIANLPPTVDALSFVVNSITEGAQATLVGKVTDPGVNDVLTVTIDWGDGAGHSTVTVDGTTGLFQATHTYNDRANSTAVTDVYTASVTAHDNDGASSSPAATASVTVGNAAPSLTNVVFSPAIANEGQAVTVSGTIVDPGVNDTHTLTVAWGDGTATTMATVNPDGTFTATHTYANNQANNAPYAVVLTVADDDGASVSINASIQVDNVPPTVTLSGAGSATVGTAYALTWSATDPGTDTISGWQVDWGDGTVQTYAGTATGAGHVYTLPGSYTMSVVAADNDAPNYTYTATTKGMVAGVTGADVSAGGPYAVVQGGSVTLAASGPGTVSSYSWDLNGDGRADVSSHTASVTLSWAQLTQMGLGDVGRFSVTATVTYAGGVSVTSATAAHLLVTNTPPTVADLAFSAAPQAGQPVTVSGKVVDPGTADIESVMVAWGDGTATMATVNADRTFSAVHTYADQPTSQTTYSVTLVVADDNGGSYWVSASLTVANVPPDVSVTGAPAATIGQTYTLAFSATDPANDPVSGWLVDWGDGTIQSFAASATGASHVYQTASLYEVSVSALDEQALGYYPTASKLVIVPALPVIPVVPAVTPVVPVLPVTVVEAMANNGGSTTAPVGPPPVLVISTAPQLPSVTIGYTPVSYSSQPQLQSDNYVFSYGGGDRGHSRTEAPKTDRKPQQQQPQNQDGQRGQPETRDAQQPSRTDGDPKGQPGEQPGERGPASTPPGDRDAPQNGQDGADHGAAPADEKSGQQQQNERTNDGAAAPGPALAPQPPAVPEGTPPQQGEVQKPDRRARTESPDWVYLGALAAIPAIAANDVKSPAGWSVREKAGRKRVA